MSSVQYLGRVVGEGALLLTVAVFVLGMCAVFLFGPKFPTTPSIIRMAALATVIFVPVGFGAWWIFRRFRSHSPRPEAIAVAVCFAVFSLLSLVVSIPLATISGGYAGYWGRPFGLISAFVSIVLALWLATFLPSALILWLLRRRRGVEVT